MPNPKSPIELQVNSIVSGTHQGFSVYIYTPETTGYMLGYNMLRFAAPSFKPEHIQAMIANMRFRVDGKLHKLVPTQE